MKKRIFILLMFAVHFSLLNPPQNVAFAATNGSCGISHTAVLTVAPAADLCASGTPSAVTGSGPWIWKCSSINGGTTASCGAYLKGEPAINLPQTGQTTSYAEGDDGGALRFGAPRPSSRFTDNSVTYDHDRQPDRTYLG